MRNGKRNGLFAVLCVAAGVLLAWMLSQTTLSGIARMLLRLALIAVILLAVLTAVVIFFALRGTKDSAAPKAAQKPVLTKAQKEILSEAKSELLQSRSLMARIRNSQIRAHCAPILESVDWIFRALEEQPEDISRLRTFFNYYLPTLGNILRKYEYLERSSALREDTTQKVLDCLDQIAHAMQRQYENLFEDDLIDMTAEMQTLRAICRRDGLLMNETPEREIFLTQETTEKEAEKDG